MEAIESSSYFRFSIVFRFLSFAAVYLPAGSTLVAVEPWAFETMSKALTRNTNCHPFKDATGAVFATCRCIGLRQCQSVQRGGTCFFQHGKMGSLLGSWTSNICNHRERSTEAGFKFCCDELQCHDGFRLELPSPLEIFSMLELQIASQTYCSTASTTMALLWFFNLCRSNDTTDILYKLCMFDLCNIHLHTRTYLSVGHRDLYARSTEQPKWSIVWSLHKLGTLRLWSSPVRRQQVEKKVYTPLGASATNSANHGGVSDEIWCIVSSFGFGSWKNTVASARECVCMFKGFLLSFDRWDVLGSLLKSWLRYELFQLAFAELIM